jgi:hypothetical protein
MILTVNVNYFTKNINSLVFVKETWIFIVREVLNLL